MNYDPLNSETAPLITAVTKAAAAHFAEANHDHRHHPLRECPSYLDAIEELIRTVHADAQTKLGVIRDSVGPVFRVWRGELFPVDGVGIQITRDR